MYFSLLPCKGLVSEFNDPVEGVTIFAQRYSQQDAFTSEKAALESRLAGRLSSLENYLEKTQARLLELETDSNYKLRADLIMANLHAIKPGTESLSLPDFYHENRMVDIKLKKDLTPQKNAEILYKKAKNQQIEKDHVLRMLKGREAEKTEVSEQLKALSNVNDLKYLRSIAENLAEPEKEKKQAPLPYREVFVDGFKIWIGKNAQSNDILTLKYSFKDDLWLHAKDVAGSHVLLKYQSGKNFPRGVIEKAAQLAAYYSKRKNESLCPVSVTQKKYVRKRKGDPAGVVVVEREEVMMVVPEKFEG
jgi:predicted ribosome quality control (RQC) complex YloA/Tae2 family protein